MTTTARLLVQRRRLDRIRKTLVVALLLLATGLVLAVGSVSRPVPARYQGP